MASLDNTIGHEKQQKDIKQFTMVAIYFNLCLLRCLNMVESWDVDDRSDN